MIVDSFRFIKAKLAWNIGNGEKFIIGLDPWVGCNEGYELPRDLFVFLNNQGIFSLNQVANVEASSMWHQGWKIFIDLHLDPQWVADWEKYTRELQ